MQKIEPLEFEKFYHIYNCGINGTELFRENTNYEYFLKLYHKYINPVADTFAWCLMGNHFHFLVKIKDENKKNNNRKITPDRVLNPVRVGTPSQQFSKLFNAYAQAYNKRYNRHGSLFERPFKRKYIDNEKYLIQLVIYIHNNPVHHGFTLHPEDYAWCSYQTFISLKPTKLKRDEVINWFDDIPNFKSAHQNKIDYINIENLLEI
jgi:REP element-mobilizing transposase RayT